MGKRLRTLGISDYREYLRSTHWVAFRDRYRASEMPQRCVGCDRSDYQLHHVNYHRLGREELTDVIPLCRDCHQKVHEYADWNRMGVDRTGAILEKLFGRRTRDELAAFRRKKEKPKKPARPRYGNKVKKVVPRNDLIAITRQIAVNLGWEEPKVYTPIRLGQRREEILDVGRETAVERGRIDAEAEGDELDEGSGTPRAVLPDERRDGQRRI